MIINDLDGCYIVFDTKNKNTELATINYIRENAKSMSHLLSKALYYIN